MQLSDKFSQLTRAQKLKICARMFQLAEDFLGIAKPMSPAELQSKQRQIELLADGLATYGWIKIGSLKDLAISAAMEAEINHVTPALFLRYLAANATRYRYYEPSLALPEHKPAPVSDDTRLQQLREYVTNVQARPSGDLYYTLIANVYYPILVRLGLVADETSDEFRKRYEKEAAINRLRFKADIADIKTRGAFEKFIAGIDSGIYGADAARRVKTALCEEYILNLKTIEK